MPATTGRGRARWIAACMATEGHVVSRKRVQRLMRLLGLAAIYQRPNTSKPVVAHKIYPSLLGGLALLRSFGFLITYYPQPSSRGTKQEHTGCFCGFERWRATRCNFKRGSARPSLLFFTEQRISAGRR
jgi:hypothetical protein